MGDIYDYIADCEFNAKWNAEMPKEHERMIKDLREQIRRLENRVKYWKRKAKKNET